MRPSHETPRRTGVVYRTDVEGVAPEQLRGFFVGWPAPPTPETHLRILRAASECVVAVDTSSGNVIGFVTALTDGIHTAFIPHLEVLPVYQGRGVGSELLGRMLERLAGLYAIDLVADDDLEPFYRRFGMRRVGAMVIRDYAAQAGRPESR